MKIIKKYLRLISFKLLSISFHYIINLFTKLIFFCHLIKMNPLKVGWIGFGVMGKSMAGHVIKSGYTLNVWNRTKSKTDEAVNLGANYMDP